MLVYLKDGSSVPKADALTTRPTRRYPEKTVKVMPRKCHIIY